MVGHYAADMSLSLIKIHWKQTPLRYRSSPCTEVEGRKGGAQPIMRVRTLSPYQAIARITPLMCPLKTNCLFAFIIIGKLSLYKKKLNVKNFRLEIRLEIERSCVSLSSMEKYKQSRCHAHCQIAVYCKYLIPETTVPLRLEFC